MLCNNQNIQIECHEWRLDAEAGYWLRKITNQLKLNFFHCPRYTCIANLHAKKSLTQKKLMKFRSRIIIYCSRKLLRSLHLYQFNWSLNSQLLIVGSFFFHSAFALSLLKFEKKVRMWACRHTHKCAIDIFHYSLSLYCCCRYHCHHIVVLESWIPTKSIS